MADYSVLNPLSQTRRSFLRVSDSSIVASNRTRAPDDDHQNRDEKLEKTEDKSKEDKIRVYLRIKKSNDHNLYQVKGKELVCSVPKGCFISRNLRYGETCTRTFKFTHIFPSGGTQEELFNTVVKPKLLHFLNGENSTTLTYGASGSGKTHTVIGTETTPGLVPRCLEYLFRTLPSLSANPVCKPLPNDDVIRLDVGRWKRDVALRNQLIKKCFSSAERNHHMKIYNAMQSRLSSESVAHVDEFTRNVSLSVWISFVEIYNEQIYDLLEPEPITIQKQRTKLQLGQSGPCGAFVKNLSILPVSSGAEAYQLLQYGLTKIKYAATNINDHSSRSHSIFTLRLLQVSPQEDVVHVSKFNFCDLAGSERTKKTLNVGERLKESKNINGSLMILGRCIKAIRETQNRQNDNCNRLVPFRESKLTQLFQNALSGHEDVSMIVTLNPATESFDESMHVLNFSAIAKDIKIDNVQANRANPLDACAAVAFEPSKVDELQNAIFEREDAIAATQEMIDGERAGAEYMQQSYEELMGDMKRDKEEYIRIAKQQVILEYENKTNDRQDDEDDLLVIEEDHSPNLDVVHINNVARLRELTIECEDLEREYQRRELETLQLMEASQELELQLAAYDEQLTLFMSDSDKSSLDDDHLL